MYRKFLTLVMIAGALALILFVKSFLFSAPKSPRLIDRLPTADFLAKANILELAKETNSLLQYNKLSIRDFTTYEFLLGQGKQYGLDLEQDAYLFAQEDGDWGALIKLTDSAKVQVGIERLRKYADLQDSIIGSTTFYYIKKEKSYLHYGKDYAFIYQGAQFERLLNQVVSAHYGDLHPDWKVFLKQKQFKNEHLVIYANWPKLKRYNIQTAMFAHDSDSLGFKLKSYVKKKTPLYFSMKRNGLTYNSVANTDRLIDVHLEINEFKQHPEDSVYVQLAKLSKKVGFPFERFLKAWNGELVYQQGGFQVQQTRYIETILDEDFNETEVERVRLDTVPAFSLFASLNQMGPLFISKLAQKGLLRPDEDGYRFLFSPLLHFNKVGPFYQYYSGDMPPRIVRGHENQVLWKHKGTNYYFRIERMTRYEVFGTLQVPVRSLLRRNKLI
ncbi:MAG: hypothetical protein ACKOBN_00335 [Flavobacteriales bacterium]